MYKKIVLFTFVLLLLLGTASAAFALPADYGPIDVLLFSGSGQTKTTVYPAYLSCNGEAVETDVPAMLFASRTLVPIRFVGELLGAKIGWDQETSQATFEKADTKITLEIGSATAYVNEKAKALPGDVSVELATYQGNARTMVPLRFVSEELGAEVDWDSANKTVLLTLPTEEEEEPAVPAEEELAVPAEEELAVPAEEELAVPVPGSEPGSEEEAPTVSQWQEWIAEGNVQVVIDAGHGGSDPGAIAGDTKEKDIDLPVALKVQSLLEDNNIDVLMTREDDTYPTLSERPALANENKATLFVSIHSNAADATSVTGIETYYATENPETDMSKALAQFIQEAIVAETSAKDRGVKDSNFVVLREALMPAALVEVGFMTNETELAQLNDEAYQDLLAKGIYQGIVDFLASIGMSKN